MAPKRPPRADVLFRDGYDPAGVTGVLICRAEGSAAQALAIQALEVDVGWSHDEAVEAVLSAQIEPGRWFKTPNRNGDGWLLHAGGGHRPRSGATPGVCYRFG